MPSGAACWRLDDRFLDHKLDFCIDLIHPDDRDRVSKLLAASLVGSDNFASEHRLRRADGMYIWVQDRGKVIERGPKGEAIRIIGSFRDITEQRAWAERQSHLLTVLQASATEARQQEALFRGVFDGSPDCMVLADMDRKILSCNSAFKQAFGYETDELNGMSSKVIYSEHDEWDRLLPHIRGAGMRATRMHVSFRRKDDSSFPGRLTALSVLDGTGNQIGALAIIRDISVEQSRDQALKEKRHLEALGRLTGGIAHDFNNLLTIISANLQLMDMRLDDNQSRHCITEALNAADMGARLNQRLMTFARQRQLDPVATNVNKLATQLLDFVQRAIGESIEVQTDLVASPAMVMIDASELENAIVNLALNARDAMPDGGHLKLETRNLSLDAMNAAALGDVRPGEYIQLTMTDTGVGMSDEIKAHIFEPFFTTKGPGKGTGLGLTTIHGFVKQSGGQVAVISAPGKGTSISLLLPLLADFTAEAGLTSAYCELPKGAGELVLLVEDNASVREVTAARLALLGYRVIEADMARTALDIVSEVPNVDVVFSDIVMPGGMSGFDLASHLGEVRPDLPVLLTSGFPDTAHGASSQKFTGRILAKPYSHRDLAVAIRTALAEAEVLHGTQTRAA